MSTGPSELDGMRPGQTVTHSRRGLHGRVVDLLGRRIVQGDLTPGTILEPERMATELQVSRTVVREVIKVLTSKGLLDARPRTGTFVLPRERWNLLDADVIEWRDGHDSDARQLVELEEVRQIIEPWAARMAAERRTNDHVSVLETAFDGLVAADADGDGLAEYDLRFHRAIVAAAQNELLERLGALLEPVLRARDELAGRHEHGATFLDKHRAVLDQITAQDGDGAYAAMTDLLREAAADTAVNIWQDSKQKSRRTPKGASARKTARKSASTRKDPPAGRGRTR